MRAVLFFLALVVLARSQCSPIGNAYAAGPVSWTVGAPAVNGAIPLIQLVTDSTLFTQGRPYQFITFMTITQITSRRWEVSDVGFYGQAFMDCGDVVGQYNFDFSTDCSSVTISVISDTCSPRASNLDGLVLSLTTSPYFYGSPGRCSSYAGTLGSDGDGHLSGQPVSFFPGPSNLTIVTVANQAVFFQLWTRRDFENDPPNFHLIQDLFSVPAPFACLQRLYGQYFLQETDQCGAILCGKADACPERAELFQGVSLNDYVGPQCSTDIEVVQWPLSGCSNGNVWVEGPGECTSQGGGDQCIYCHGVANGNNVKLCINRNGGSCNHIFRSLPAQHWCNLEFECHDPASTLSLSVIALFTAVLVFILH